MKIWKYVILFSILIFLTSSFVKCQNTFEKFYSMAYKSVGVDIVEINNTYYILSTLYYGDYYNTDSASVVILKINVNGDTLFTKVIPDTTLQRKAISMIYSSFKQFYIITSDINLGIILTKLDSNCNVLFEKRYLQLGSSYGTKIVETDNNEFVIGGNNSDNILMKIDSIGTVLWIKSYGGDDSEYFNSIICTSDTGYLLGSLSNSFNQYTCGYLIKVNQYGDTLWTKKNIYYHTYSLQETLDHNYIVAGETNDNGEKIYLQKLNVDGNILWTKLFGTANEQNRSPKVIICNEGGFLIVNNNSSFQHSSNIDIYRTDSTGNLLWSKNFGNLRNESYNNAIKNLDGGFSIVGTSFKSSSSDPKYIYLIKTDQFGNIPCPDSVSFSISGGFCQGYSIQFYNTSLGTSNYIWILDSIVQPENYYFNQIFNDTLWHTIKLVSCFDTVFKSFKINQIPLVDFNYIINFDTVFFFDQTYPTASNWHWEFDDNTDSYLQNPVHVFDTSSNHIARLHATANGCFNSIEHTLNFKSVIESFQFSDYYFSLYPNPTNSTFHIKANDKNEKYNFYLTNNLGQRLIEVINQKGDIDIDFTAMSCGIYYIQIFQKNKLFNQKILKNN